MKFKRFKNPTAVVKFHFTLKHSQSFVIVYSKQQIVVDLEAIFLSSAQSHITDAAFVNRRDRIFTATFLTSLRMANFAYLLSFAIFLDVYTNGIMNGHHFFSTCRFIKQCFCYEFCIFLMISFKARSSPYSEN